MGLQHRKLNYTDLFISLILQQKETNMKITEIQELIKFVAKSGVSEVEIEDKDFKINIKTPASKRGKGSEVTQQMMPQGMQMMQPQYAQPMQQQIPQAAPAPAPAPAAPAQTAEDKAAANYIEIKSPMIGTFYRSPSPDKPQFVKVGDTIKAGDVVCIIEAMKLFNEIEAEVSGKVVKVLVDDMTPVEYDQPLLLIDPS
jgi:acetyl-CoA carboxylase biotin carboxyl carrier protein